MLIYISGYINQYNIIMKIFKMLIKMKEIIYLTCIFTTFISINNLTLSTMVMNDYKQI